VLLLNDRYDPNWGVFVDGKLETLLRCNYLMRGVHLGAGQHTVEFRFQPPYGTLKVSLAGAGLGVILLGGVMVTGRRRLEKTMTARQRPAPAKAGSKGDLRQPVAQVSRNAK